jgi:hypothetical protein
MVPGGLQAGLDLLQRRFEFAQYVPYRRHDVLGANLVKAGQGSRLQ